MISDMCLRQNFSLHNMQLNFIQYYILGQFFLAFFLDFSSPPITKKTKLQRDNDDGWGGGGGYNTTIK